MDNIIEIAARDGSISSNAISLHAGQRKLLVNCAPLLRQYELLVRGAVSYASVGVTPTNIRAIQGGTVAELLLDIDAQAEGQQARVNVSFVTNLGVFNLVLVMQVMGSPGIARKTYPLAQG